MGKVMAICISEIRGVQKKNGVWSMTPMRETGTVRCPYCLTRPSRTSIARAPV